LSRKPSQIVGIIFPFLPTHVRRFFDEGKTVFVKFYGIQTTPKRLSTGDTLFFYESKGNKEIVGEARIVEVDQGTPSEILTKHGDRLFLMADEFEEYVGERKGRKMLVLVVEGARKYANPLKLGKSLTMAGQYMTKEFHDQLKASGRATNPPK
jgi:hypothetical protein